MSSETLLNLLREIVDFCLVKNIGVLISGVVFGVFAIGVALLLLAVYFFASRMLES